MFIKKMIFHLCLVFFLGLISSHAFALVSNDYFLGQTIQINTLFHSFLGNPSWLIVIRDVNHGQNIPYLFDIRKGENTWLLFTQSKNYLIIASTLQINTYGTRHNRFKKYTLHNFCQLESHGKIMRGKSLYLTITGDLTPDADSVNCRVSSYTTAN